MPLWSKVVNKFMPEGSKVAERKTAAESVHDRDRIIIRLPNGMRDKISELAETNGRSMTSEVVAAIEQHLKGPSRIDAIEAFIEKHREMLHEMAAYEWTGKDGIFDSLERLRKKVREHDEQLNPDKYHDDD